MIFITFNALWSLTFFLLFTYIVFVMSLLIYLLPLITKSLFYSNVKTRTHFTFINSYDFIWIISTPLAVLLVPNLLWSSPVLLAWVGHLFFGTLQLKIFYFLAINFLCYLLVFTSTHYFTSTEIFDYTIGIYQLFYWVYWLFAANSLFTVIFLIEILNVVMFFLVVCSTFSSTFFYKNINLNYSHFLSTNPPRNYLQSLLYLFWISLIASLLIFLFLLFLYLTMHTFDWVLVEYIFLYTTLVSSTKDLITLGLTWLVLLVSIFLKCGVAPIYFWKPDFFQGLPLGTLLFYITFVYFNFLLFLTHFTTLYLGELFYYYVFLFWFIILFSVLTLLLIITESYYLKIFLAISSILNSVFIFLLLTTSHTSSGVFIL